MNLVLAIQSFNYIRVLLTSYLRVIQWQGLIDIEERSKAMVNWVPFPVNYGHGFFQDVLEKNTLRWLRADYHALLIFITSETLKDFIL